MKVSRGEGTKAEGKGEIMSIVKWERVENVAIVYMNQDGNKQNLAFGQAMNSVLDEVIQDAEITAVVLASTDPKHWSVGVDVEWVLSQMNEPGAPGVKDFMYTMNEVFRKLLLFPVPVIAAINGHAFGNGALLACACDFRMMNMDRGFFCFPEVDLGIPFLPGMTAFSRKAIPEYKLNELVLTGKKATARELAEDHVIVKACENPQILMEEAVAFACTFQKKRGIFGELKKRMHKSIVEVFEKEDPAYIESLFLFVRD